MVFLKPTSFSQTDLFNTCPRTWYMKYVQKIPGIENLVYAHRGTVVHHCLEQYYPDKKVALEDLKKLFEEQWFKYKLHESMLRDKKDESWLMILHGIEMDLHVTSVEMKIYYPDVVGYIDIVNSRDGSLSDWKTSTRSKYNEVSYMRQLKYYAWLYYRKFGKLPSEVNVKYLKYTGTKAEFGCTPTMEDVKNAEDWHFRTRERMEYFIKHPEKLPPFNTGYFFCPYKHLWDLDFQNPNTLMKFVIEQYGNFFYIKGDVDIFLSKHLDKKYSYELKNAYYIKKAKPNANTMVRFWHKTQKRLPIGFLQDVMKTLHDYAEFRKKTPVITINDKRYLDDTKIEMPDKLLSGKTLRPYQIDAVDTYVNRNKVGMLELTTGGGKTLIAAEIIRRVGCKTLFVVDKKELLYQAKETFEENLGIEVGVIGDGKKELKDVTVATIQTLNKNIQEYKEYLSEVRCLMCDECFHPNTKVILGNGSHISIKDIYENDDINEVLSFNEKTQLFESKKILRKIKQPMNENWFRVIIEDEIGNKHKLLTTPNHKIWTEDGYKRADQLQENDVLKVYLEPVKYICPICKESYNSRHRYGYCLYRHKKPDGCSKGGITASNILKERRRNDKYYDAKLKTSMREGIKYAKQGSSYWEGKRRMGAKRKGKHNPIFVPGALDKMKQSMKNWFASLPIQKQHEQIQRFVNAPRFTCNKNPTKPEQTIIDMNIMNLSYTGKGNCIYTFKNGKRKIPDFKVKNEAKVIEVGDFEYWHTKEEAEDVVNQYAKIGVSCLYLDAKDVVNEKCVDILKKFCYNHKAKVISCGHTTRGKGLFRYNLEVEDNNNYIANKVLVSNCHKVAAKSYYKLGSFMRNTEYRLGITATAFRDDGNDMMLTATLGNIVYSLTGQELIEQGYLMKPDIVFIKTNISKDEQARMESESLQGLINEVPRYGDFYPNFIVKNERRNDIIKKLCIDNPDKTILVLVKLIEHGKMLEELIPDSQYIYGETPGKIRTQALTDFKAGKLKVLVSTISIFAEGVDIPSLDIVINAAANKGDIKSIQVLGRVLRRKEGKEKAMYYDFADEGKFFYTASRARATAFKNEGHQVRFEEYEGGDSE